MKIKDLNSKAKDIKEIELLIESIEVKYKELLRLDEKMSNEIKDKLTNVRDSFEKEVLKYFNDEGLKTNFKDDIIIARNDDISIKIFNYYDDFGQYDQNQELYKIEIDPININNTIIISPSSEDDSMFSWKNVIRIGDKIIVDKNIKSELLACNDKNELMKVIEDIDENLKYMHINLNKIKNAKYVYSTHKYDDVECSTFKELFEEYIE